MSDDLEARIRAALADRAARITEADLRPAEPPTLYATRRPAFGVTVRVLIGAAALVVLAVLLLPGPADRRVPPQPAAPPSADCGTYPVAMLSNGTVVGIMPSGASLPPCPWTPPPIRTG